MYKLAVISFHGCPISLPGEKNVGGMNVYLLQLAIELGKYGVGIDIFTRRHNQADPEVANVGLNARIIHLEAGPVSVGKEDFYDYLPTFLNNLLRYVRLDGAKYDLIHSHYWLSGVVGTSLNREWGIPHVATFHTLAKRKLQLNVGEKESQIRVTSESVVMNIVDNIVVSTEQEKEDLKRLYQVSPHKVKVISPGVDIHLFTPTSKVSARRKLGVMDKNLVLYVGRIEPLKGLDILIDAISKLELSTDTMLMIVGGDLQGDSEISRLKNLSQKLGIQDSVIFSGSVPQSELPLYYNAADVFVLPSYYESFGLVALEAMACGIPVVASRVGGPKTFIKSGENGYIIPWHCAEPFAEHLDVLLSNPVLRDSMGKMGRIKASSMSWESVANEMNSFYDSVIKLAQDYKRDVV